jgi:hypothetical protein
VVSLEQLRKRAKELARAARAGEPAAVARLGDLPPRLASAQLVLAREQGYSSWPTLVHEVAEQPFHTDLDYYEGRARSGADKGYFMFVPEDCCSTMNADWHNASINYALQNVSTVTNCDAVVAAIAG